MGRVWLGTPQSSAGGVTERPDRDTPRPFDRQDAAAIARLSRPLRPRPAQQHSPHSGAGHLRHWWQRLFRWFARSRVAVDGPARNR
jgi:hypothetical protein